MDKLNLQTTNVVDENIKRIGENSSPTASPSGLASMVPSMATSV